MSKISFWANLAEVKIDFSENLIMHYFVSSETDENNSKEFDEIMNTGVNLSTFTDNLIKLIPEGVSFEIERDTEDVMRIIFTIPYNVECGTQLKRLILEALDFIQIT